MNAAKNEEMKRLEEARDKSFPGRDGDCTFSSISG